MTEAQLYALLDSYEEKVSNDEDRKLFAEAVRAAKASAPRSAYLTLWICCVESLKRRFGELPKRDPIVNELLAEISAMEATQEPSIAVLVEKAQQYDLLLSAGAAKLKRIYSMQQLCRHASEASPSLADFVADSFAVVDSVLCRAGMLECSSTSEQTLVLSRDITSLVNTLRQQFTIMESVKSS
ncbi:MAG: hypothetical protein KME45_20360 [Stenomitos rutilans HA7619-LM2]|jgi:hypothetical protein|nr:hypothetical protein [Stenomitos rutilans HA7619-LM2]